MNIGFHRGVDSPKKTTKDNRKNKPPQVSEENRVQINGVNQIKYETT